MLNQNKAALKLDEVLKLYGRYNPNSSSQSSDQSDSASYCLDELLKLQFLGAEGIREVHKAKLTYGDIYGCCKPDVRDLTDLVLGREGAALG